MSNLYAANTYSFTLSHTVAASLEILAAHGFRAFEAMISPDHLWPEALDPAARRELAARASGAGLRIISINQPNIDLNLAALDPGMRRLTLDRLLKSVDLAADLGAAQVVVGPGKPNPLLPAPRERLMDSFLAAFGALRDRARARGVSLALENMPFAFLPAADDLVEALARIDDPTVGVVYDVANAVFIGADPVAELGRLAGRVTLVHVSDTGRTRYLHAPIGAGEVPFDAIGEALAALGYGGPVVAEIISDRPAEHLPASYRALRALGWPIVLEPGGRDA